MVALWKIVFALKVKYCIVQILKDTEMSYPHKNYLIMVWSNSETKKKYVECIYFLLLFWKLIEFKNHRITESFKLEESSKIIRFHCLPSTAMQIAKSYPQVSHPHAFEHLQRWWFCHFPEQPIPVLDKFQKPYIQSKLALMQPETIWRHGDAALGSHREHAFQWTKVLFSLYGVLQEFCKGEREREAKHTP